MHLILIILSPFLTTQPYSPNWQSASTLVPPSKTSEDGTVTYDYATNIGFENIPLNWINPELIYYDLRYIFVEYDGTRWLPSFIEW